MIHHYLTETEINHLTELHHVNFCKDCKHYKSGKIDNSKKINIGRCINEQHKKIVNDNIECEDFKQKHRIGDKK